jgi:hypothetical protein
MEKGKTYRSADNVVYVVVIALVALLWMLSPFMRSALTQEQLVEFKDVATSTPHLEKYGKGNRTVVIDVRGVLYPLSLNTYTYSALSPSFLSDVSAGDTVMLGLQKDVYDRRIVRKEERSFAEGTHIEVFTVATPVRTYATVGDFNAAKQKDYRLGWVVGPLVLIFLAFCWRRERRLDSIGLLETLLLFGLLITIVIVWNKSY